MMIRKITLSLLLMFAVLATSCSKNGPEVPMESTGASLEGTVYYGESPVANAMIILATQGPGAKSMSGMADDDGHFKLDNAPVGQVLIGVNTDASKGMMMGKAMAGTNPLEKKGAKASVQKVTDVPKKFHDPINSGLKTDVNRGSNKFDIKIPK